MVRTIISKSPRRVPKDPRLVGSHLHSRSQGRHYSNTDNLRDQLAVLQMDDAKGVSYDHSRNGFGAYAQDNHKAWEAMANEWQTFQSPHVQGKTDDGNDMFTQCLLPIVDELAEWRPNDTVLDLGAGSGIIARLFARKGAHVTGLDFSEAMLQKGRERTQTDEFPGSIHYDWIDLMDYDGMREYMDSRKSEPFAGKFDIVTISTTLKSLPSLDPIAKALPLMLKPRGRIVIVDLHPVFSKPAGHRGMEIFEDPTTGKQQLSTYIKVPKYLNIPPCKSEAVRGQPEPLPFFNNGLVLDAMREPAFTGEPDPRHAQSYHNFQQTPMLLALRLRLAPSR